MATKNKSYASLKRKLDAVFSRWLRSNAADDSGHTRCFTCGQREFWQDLQCGHFVSRTYLATRWNPDNCKPQCVRCNVFMGGAKDEFAFKLGQDMVVHLVALKREPVKFSRADLQALIEEYTAKATA